VGSFAASFVPVVKGAKFLNFLGDTVKRFTNPRLYKTEQAIKNTLGDFQNTVKQSAEQSAKNNLVDKSQSLADSINTTQDLQKQLATKSAKEPIRKAIKSEQENSQNILDNAYADSKNIQDLNERLGNQYSELEKLHKLFSSTEDLPKIFPNGEIVDNVIFGKDLSFTWGLSGQDFFDNFIYKNNANVIYQEDIEKFVNKTQYEKYLLALKLENETAK
jgi:predicted RNase H-like nuclease (RuvC/YqgF family)